MAFEKLTLEEKERRKEERKRLKYEREHRIIYDVDHKLCAVCNIYKPSTTEYFYKNDKNSTDGLHNRCIKCEIIKAGQWIKNNPESFKKAYKNYMKTDSWRAYKKENYIKTKDLTIQWRKDHPEKTKQYIQNHRNHDISTKEWKACQEYFNYVCAYCGKTLEQQYKQNNHQFHKEHVDHEGYNDVRNCVPACTNCNSTKKEKTIEHLFNINIISTFTQDRYDKIMLWCNEDYKQYIEEKPPYKIKHSRIYREDGTYYLQAELWIVDNKRNFIKCIATEVKKKDLNLHIQKYFGYM